jgi:pyrophosphatase PpaX
MKISTIIFDIDGVLIDSNKIIIEAYRKTSKKLGLRIPSDSEIIGVLGKPLKEIVTILWPNFNKELLIKEYRKLFLDKNLFILPVDGAVGAVEKLKKSDLKLGLLSGKIKFFIEKHLREAGFDLNLFDIVLPYEATKNHKPHPEPLLFACKKLNVKPREVLYIGDSQLDYECAKNAKVHYVGVLTGCLSEEELREMGVENIIPSVSDLPKFLKIKKW